MGLASGVRARLESWRAVSAWLGSQQKVAGRAISALETELAAEAARRRGSRLVTAGTGYRSRTACEARVEV
ncbi:hypothetical protein ACIQWR_38570 [Streptomyces sp. NPDC098789]|uniref:hypothetical protein n=1 Tax=Streptomyces sp. NPDC098789 TaxID=3366098 RepID=UPI0038183FCE